MNKNIIEFTHNKRYIKEFIDIGNSLYKNDTQFIPAFKSKIEFQLSEHNPFLNYGSIKNFILRINGHSTGRISAMINQKAKFKGEPVGYLGFYEAIDSNIVSDLLIEAGLRFLKKKGIRHVLGPINFSTWYPYRFIIKNSNEPIFFLEPYNKNYYPIQWERYGFKLIRRYYSSIIKDQKKEVEKLKEQLDLFYSKGYYFRNLDLKNFKQDLRLLYDLTCRIFQRNWGYTEIDFTEFYEMYRDIKKLIPSEYMIFAYDYKNNPCGFLFTLPDLSNAIRVMKGKQGILNKIKFLMKRNSTKSLIFKTIGVIPKFRRVAVGSALVCKMQKLSIQRGFKSSIHALMIEDNNSRRYASGISSIIREYGLYYINI